MGIEKVTTPNNLWFLSQKWKKILDDKGFGGAVLMNLLEAFDTLYHKLLIAKPESVLGPLLLNLYLNDLFCLAESTKVCNFADDTTFCACNKNLKTFISRLEQLLNGLKATT